MQGAKSEWSDRLIASVTTESKSKRKALEVIKAILEDPSAQIEENVKKKLGVALIKHLADTALLKDGTPAFLHRYGLALIFALDTP